ncbi:response regulator [Mesorhizobium sp. B2-3-5]|uniref:response regulator n=1 Tax=Mesorhizobium sp. B2-3-5 TaxID=2589958 RepID=UPI001126B180|nr:response regulator [Mesorhizobium sp. B2-3-5]TPM21594.1 response regulator [Mesorhizobium sp. B2-3-5]
MTTNAVLVVEDEPLIQLDLETALVEAGFDVVTANSAAQAITLFDAGPQRFKALLTDIRLGPGQTGWDVARHVRREIPTFPVVYLSGDGAIYWGSEGVPNSIMISKPSFLPQVITALATLLNEQEPSPDAV